MPEYLVYFEYESSLLPMSGIPEEPANLDELYRADLA